MQWITKKEDNDSDAGVMEYAYDPDSDIKKPHLISQAELDDLVCDLSLSKETSERWVPDWKSRTYSRAVQQFHIFIIATAN